MSNSYKNGSGSVAFGVAIAAFVLVAAASFVFAMPQGVAHADDWTPDWGSLDGGCDGGCGDTSYFDGGDYGCGDCGSYDPSYFDSCGDCGNYDPSYGCDSYCNDGYDGCDSYCNDGYDGCDSYCNDGYDGCDTDCYDDFTDYCDGDCEYGTGGEMYTSSTGHYTGGGGGFRFPSFGGGSSGSSVSRGSNFYPVMASNGVPSHAASNNTTVTTTNVSNVNNSINGSFNNYNSNNVAIADHGSVSAVNPTSVTVVPVSQITTPYHPVQYTYPTPTYPAPTYPIYDNNVLSCSVTALTPTIQNGQTTWLRWASYGASNAWFSGGIGNVSTNGTIAVAPMISQSYTLTVTDYQGHTRTCTTYVAVSGGVPYVALSQIPYTGYDFGVVGNTIYWMSLLAFAVAGAYLMVYYRGGAFAFATEMFSGLSRGTHSPIKVTVPMKQVSAPVAQKIGLDEVAIKAVAVDRVGTKDTLVFSQAGENDMPRLVISRA